MMISEVLRRAFGDMTFTIPEAALVLGIRDASSTMNRLKQLGVVRRVGRGAYAFQETPGLEPWPGEALGSASQERLETLVDLGRAAWAWWGMEGKVTVRGPRRYRYVLGTSGVRPVVRRRAA